MQGLVDVGEARPRSSCGCLGADSKEGPEGMCTLGELGALPRTPHQGFGAFYKQSRGSEEVIKGSSAISALMTGSAE